MTSNSSSKPESFPLIITDDLNGLKSVDQNDWSDQELDDLFQSPIEEVLDSMRYRTSSKISRKDCLKSVLYLSLISFVFGVSFAVVFISGYNSVNINRNISPKVVTKIQSTNRPKQMSLSSKTNVSDIRHNLLDNISVQRIAQNLQKLTQKPIVGDTGLDDNTLFVYNKWKKLGLNTSFANYSVLLSFQSADKPNSVIKFSKSGQLVHNSSQFESSLNASAEEAQYYGLNPPFLAYSPSTDTPLIGTPIYVNYGRAEDYEYLSKINISISGHIVIVRYGKIFRGNIVELAQNYGAIGVIIYSDPYDYTDGNADNTYPKSVYLPPNGVQRGTVMISDGDPQTPHYPSIESAFKLDVSKTKIPRIPAQSISYGDAQQIMSDLNGPVAPKDWIGMLNITYNIGPGYQDESYLSIEVNTYLKQSTIYNVIATIKGCVEPDRYVLVGNHRDAWTFGASDPLSGTAAMIELSEALTQTMKSLNWCPRRTIVFCSWAAEEYGLIGSTEWVEENQKLLQSQAIAYLNVDVAVEGNFTFQGEAVPLLYSTVESATKFVENPNPSEFANGIKTVFDSFRMLRPSKIIASLPDIKTPGSGSDQTAFLFSTGVPVINMYYDCNKTHIKCYPLYHSMYETYDMYSKLTDRGFRYTRALTQVWAEMLRSLSDTPVLPFSDSLKYYPIFLKSAEKELFENKELNEMFVRQNITYVNHLKNAIKEFEQQIKDFTERIKHLDESNDLKLREYNDIMMYLERTFLDSQGMPFRSDWKHVVLSPSPIDSYDGTSFASVYYLLKEYTHKTTDSEKSEQMNEILKHISIIAFHINSAKLLLKQMYN